MKNGQLFVGFFGFQVPSVPSSDLLRCAQDHSRIFTQSGRRAVETREDALITPAALTWALWPYPLGKHGWLENATFIAHVSKKTPRFLGGFPSALFDCWRVNYKKSLL